MLFVSLFILASYVISVCVKFGIPNSISRSYFDIKHKWIFSIIIATSFILILPFMLNNLPEVWQWLGFLTCVGGLFVAFAPNLEDDLAYTTHMGGAIMLGITSQAIVGIICPWLLLTWIIFIPIAFNPKRVFWAEIIGGTLLFIVLFITYFNK